MRSIRYRITSLSPLLFSSNTGDPNMISTLDYIPATYLRGMFASEYIKRKGVGREAHRDEKFYNWFLKGEIKITNAYIIQKKFNKFHRLLPIPLSIQKEKNNEEKLYDLLLTDEEFDKQTKAVTGYGRLEGEVLYKKEVKKSLNFHHSRDRQRGVSKEGQIFNYESIDEGQIFEGFIIGKEEDLKDFKNIISEGIYYIGRSKNNQYGKVKFEILSQKPEEFTSEIKPIENRGENVILTLLSDTIIYNEWGYSTTDIKDLEKKLNCKIKKAFIRQSEREGFVSVWQLKTPSEVCFRAGSCFLIENPDWDKLMELQKNGIGIGTPEGFGRFVLNWQTEKELRLEDAKDEEFTDKPDSVNSEIVKIVIKNIIKEHIKNSIEIKAIEKADSFINLPSKSLLAKLEGSVADGTFNNLLKNLKETAKQKLERCRNKEKTLYDYLAGDIEGEITEIIKNINYIENISKDISYEPKKDKEYIEELKKVYLINFLSSMRKKLKGGSQNA